MIKKWLILSLATLSALHASGYKIPEQSLDSTALSGASVAANYGVDATYYNPANMAFAPKGRALEGALTYIHLTSVHFRKGAYKEDSRREDFLAPRFFYQGELKGDWRVGFSFTTPAGLSKRWHQGVQGRAMANEFTLEVFELNPTLAYKISDQWALGLGLRGIYTTGIVKNDIAAYKTTQELTGDSLDFGWNVALAFKPTPETNLSLTYRSKIDLSVEGDAKISTPMGSINPAARVTIPLPATLSVALAHDFGRLSAELVWERVFWDSYQNLNFDYDHPMHANPILRAFDTPRLKEWKNVDTYRLGVSYQMNEAWKLMAGFGMEKNPIPDGNLGFELPDSDARIYSVGARYKMNAKHEVGAAFLVSDKKDRTTSLGSFEKAQAHLFTLGYTYRY